MLLLSKLISELQKTQVALTTTQISGELEIANIQIFKHPRYCIRVTIKYGEYIIEKDIEP